MKRGTAPGRTARSVSNTAVRFDFPPITHRRIHVFANSFCGGLTFFVLRIVQSRLLLL